MRSFVGCKADGVLVGIRVIVAVLDKADKASLVTWLRSV